MICLQLREIPTKPSEDGELDEEAEWVYRQAFMTMPVSNQVRRDCQNAYDT